MTLEQRFERLERANRQWRLATFILAAILALLVYATRAPHTSSPVAGSDLPETAPLVKARRFEVVNEKGAPLVVIDSGAEGAGELSIFNAQKKQLVNLVGSEFFGGGLFLSDNKGRTKVVLTAPKDSGGVIRSQNLNGKPVVELTTSGDGGGSVSIFNNREKQILSLQPDKTNAGQLGANDADGIFKRGFGVTP